MNDRDTVTGFNEGEERLRAVLNAAFPAQQADRGTWDRIEARLEGRTARRQTTRRTLRLTFGLAAVAVLAALAVGLGPTLTAAYALERMDAAMTGAHSAHAVFWQISPDGKREKDREMWYQAGRWRMEDAHPRQAQVFADGKHWIYEAEVNRVTLQRRTSPFLYASSGFTLSSMARDAARWGWKDRLRILGDTTVAGRPARKVMIERADEPFRSVLLVDPKTDLPLRLEVQREKDGAWVTTTAGTFRFNEALPARLFEPRFAATARIVDLDAERKAWEQRLQRGLAQKRVGDRTIVIRDLQVNAEGDIFLLYTAGRHPTDDWTDYELEMRDDLGTAYRQGANFQPYVRSTRPNPNYWPGYALNGEKLEGAWWIPAAPETPWKPRRFTLTFRVPQVSRHGQPKPGEAEEKSETVTLTQEVREPACALTPDYMPFLPTGGSLSEHDVRGGRAHARALYYRYSRQDPKAALPYYREVVELTEERSREVGQKVRNPGAWLDLYEVLHQLGRTDEARQALLRARDDAVYRDYTWDRIQQSLRAEGLDR